MSEQETNGKILDTVSMVSVPTLTVHGNPEQVAKLFDAMAKARKSFGEVVKDREGQTGHQKFKYSTLSSLTRASIDPLSDNGIAVNQFITSTADPKLHRLTTFVSGHGARIESVLEFEAVKSLQEYGKVTTYLRRYAYNAIFILDGAPDLDETGEGEEPKARAMTEGQKATIKGLFGQLGVEVDAERDAIVIGHLGHDYPQSYIEADKLSKALQTRLSAKRSAKGVAT